MPLDNIDNQSMEKIDNREIKDLLKRIEENNGIAGLLVVTQSTPRLLFRQFLIGIARGLGFTIGGTFILALIYQVISYIVSINIPYLTDLLKQFLQMLKGIS